MVVQTAQAVVARDHERLRRQHCADAAALTPRLVDRLTWSVDQLAAHRSTQLARLMRVARHRSSWHRQRLVHVDPATFGTADLDQVPVMTKDDLMEHFDEIVADPRLTLARVEAHLRTAPDAYLLGRYRALASSGSSGRRGVFVFDWHAWAIRWLSNMRQIVRGEPIEPGSPVVMAFVAAGDPTHGTSALSGTFSSAAFPAVCLPVTLPLEEMVAGLNEAKPQVLIGYPSALLPLAAEVRAGRLRIAPRRLVTTSECLLPVTRAVLEDAFGVEVTNVWSTSEAGGLAVGCDVAPGMHLSEDLMIIEAVDETGRPVGPGTPSAKIYLTNLYSDALPLIRYEITDQVTVLDGPCPCGSAHRRVADIGGRSDDVFVYGSLTVHPVVIESPLTRCGNLLEYQVRQTASGVIVAVRSLGSADLERVRAEIVENLAQLGLPDPEVAVVPVECLERQRTGKLRRFVPLTPLPPDQVGHP
jgi:phenylacetate-coenzyme A ligase PaaK-like adenylate-forming protein